MKFIPFILFYSALVFSQSQSDKDFIKLKSDFNKISNLRRSFSEFKLNQDFEFDKIRRNRSKNLLQPQLILDGDLIYYKNNNAESSNTIKSNALYPGGVLGLSVTGAGITVGIWDGGSVYSDHVELKNRVFPKDNSFNVDDHATHVAGTICASGIRASAKGIAYQSTLFTYNWNEDYDEMLTFADLGYLVSNHSYGYVGTNLSSWRFGSYDDISIKMDDLMNTYPYYQIVCAAGNDRNDSFFQVSDKQGYDLLTGMSTSKNTIVVAAVEKVEEYFDNSSVVMSSFSNYGPTDDGRIKPDIAAKGVSVLSCGISSDISYATLSGTSMASPAITGGVSLLQNLHHNINGSFMVSSLVRAVLCHAANEAGSNTGPDYEFGWGLANIENSANLIIDNGVSSICETNVLYQNFKYTKNVTLKSPQKLEVTICWTDPAGTKTPNGVADSRDSKIINNLDLKVKRNGVTYYPWKLDVENPTNAATRDSDNNVDNIEKVQIDLADPGVYTIEVSHKGTLRGGSQDFALVANSASGLVLSETSFDFDNNIVVYPNPVKDALYFSAPNGENVTNVIIYDLLGKEYINSTSVINNKIDLSDLASGVYFAKFYHNGKLLTNKFVKE